MWTTTAVPGDQFTLQTLFLKDTLGKPQSLNAQFNSQTLFLHSREALLPGQKLSTKKTQGDHTPQHPADF